MKRNIIIAVFEDENEANQALDELKQNPGSKGSFVSQAVLVKKENEKLNRIGKFDTGSHSTDDTTMGGLIGAVIGILGGPIGILFGGVCGILIGNAIDSTDAYAEYSMIERIAGKMVDGEIAIIGLTAEVDESILDEKLNKYKVTIARYDANTVAKEVKEAKKIEKNMANMAKTELRNAGKEEHEERADNGETVAEEKVE